MFELETRPSGVVPPLQRYERILNHFDRYKKFRQFLRTREAILQGERLFQAEPEELTKRGLMGPLGFNLYETTIAAIPAACLAWILETMSHTENEALFPTGSDRYWQSVFTEMNKLAPTIRHMSTAIVVPVLLLAVAITASWASLHSSDSTKETRRRCRNAFLYYDGAYGLLPQMLTSIGLVLAQHLDWITKLIDADLGSILGFVVSFPLTAAGIWQLYVLLVQIPRSLFDLNGYQESASLLAVPGPTRPWKKFLWVTIPLTFVVIPVLAFALQYGLTLSFMAFAMLKVWLKALA